MNNFLGNRVEMAALGVSLSQVYWKINGSIRAKCSTIKLLISILFCPCFVLRDRNRCQTSEVSLSHFWGCDRAQALRYRSIVPKRR